MSDSDTHPSLLEQLADEADSPLTRRKFVGAAAAAGGAALLAGRADAGGWGAEGPVRRNLIVAQSALAPTLDKEFVRGFEDTQALFNTYDTFFVLGGKSKPGPGGALVADGSRIAGLLVDSFRNLADPKINRMRVKKGVKSFYGNELTADDVIWTFERWWAHRDKFTLETLLKIPQSWRKIDKYTVEFRQTAQNYLTRPVWASSLGFPWDSTEAKKHVSSSDPWAGQWLANHSCGFGRYHVAEFTPGSRMRLVVNPNYHGAKPYFTSVTLLQVPEPANRLALLLQGSVDVAEQLGARELAVARKHPKTQVFDANQSTQTLTIMPQHKRPGTSNLKVRQALAYAIPYEQIVKSVYQGAASVANSAIPKVLPGSTGKYWKFKYDPDKARALVKEVGGQINLTMTYDTARPDIEQVAKILQSAFRNVGINVQLDGVPSATYSTRQLGHDFQLALRRDYPVVGDASYPCIYFFKAGGQVTNWNQYGNPKVDDLIDKLASTPRLKDRLPMLDEIQRHLATDVADIVIAWPGTHLATRKGLTGYVLYPDNTNRYYDLKPA